MAQKIRLREIAQLARRETIFDAEESMVTGIGTQSVKVTRKPVLVIGANRPDPYGSAIA